MLTGGKISTTEKVMFTKHLAVMLKSGIPISEAIELLRDQTSGSAFKNVLSDILLNINNGKTLADAFSKHHKHFDILYISMVRTGEVSGNLENNLSYLADKLYKDYLFKQKVISVSIYPSIIMTTLFFAGMFISLFILPKLAVLFESMDIQLPLTTRVLVWFSNLMRAHGIVIFASIFSFILLFRLSLLSVSAKRIWHGTLLKIPVLSQFIVNIEMSGVCRNIGIMIHSGIPIVDSINYSSLAVSNLTFRNYFVRLSKAVQSGSSISSAVKNGRYEYFPKIASKMIEVGEKTGKIDETLFYLGDFFENEVDSATKNLSNILEPVLLLFVGMIVAFMALAIISPIYQFTGSIQK